MNKEDWVWMPHAAHFICGHRCQFKLATCVGDFIVSTVGEMPDPLERNKGWEDIGCDRKYETYVFKASKSENVCCPYECDIGEGEQDSLAANDANTATKNHMELCEKWSDKTLQDCEEQ